MSPRAGETDDAAADPVAKKVKETTPILRPENYSAQQSTPFSYAVGTGLLVVSVMSLSFHMEWVGGQESNGNLNKPSLVAWLGLCCLFVFGFPASLILRYVRTGDASPARMWSLFLRKRNWKLSQAFCYAVGFALLDFTTALLSSWLLTIMPAPLVTVAIRFDSVCILIFTTLLTLEKPQLVQVFAVVMCVSGAVLLAMGEHKASEKMSDVTLLGCVMIVIFPALVATKYMSFKWLTKTFGSDPECMCIWLSLIGLSATCFIWPLIPFSHAVGIDVDSLRAVLDWKGIKAIALTALSITVYNFTKYPAITLTSALFASLFQVLVLPVTLIADIAILHTTTLNQSLVFGTILIIVGLATFSTAASALEKRPAGAGAADHGKLNFEDKEKLMNNP